MGGVFLMVKVMKCPGEAVGPQAGGLGLPWEWD